MGPLSGSPTFKKHLPNFSQKSCRVRAHDRDCAPHDRDCSKLAVTIQIAGSHELRLHGHDRERPSDILRLRQHMITSSGCVLTIVMTDRERPRLIQK